MPGFFVESFCAAVLRVKATTMRVRALRFGAWVALAACGGCGGGSGGGIDAGDNDAMDDADTDSAMPLPCDGACGDGEICVHDRCYGTFRRTIPAVLNRALDVLFVIDNSAGMGAKQAALIDHFQDFIDVLATVEGGVPDLHVGVVSSNMGAAGASGVPGCAGLGDDGALQAVDHGVGGTPHCAALDGDFISDSAGQAGARITNYDGDIGSVFACMASLGTGGCGFEMHLESARKALEPGENPYFYRADANLALVILADEDDCSAEFGALFGDPTANLESTLGPRTSFRCHEFGVICDDDDQPRAFGAKQGCEPQADSAYLHDLGRYVSFFDGLKADPRMLIVAGIVGDFDAASGELVVGQDPAAGAPVGQPAVARSCGGAPDEPEAGGSPAVRMGKFIDSFTGRGVKTSVCDLEGSEETLVPIAQAIKGAMGDPCISAPLADTDPGAAGVQAHCTVHDVSPDGTRSALDECADGAPVAPCWGFAADAEHCPDSPDNLSLLIDRGGESPAEGTLTEILCATEE